MPGRIRQWWPLIEASATKWGLSPYFVAAILDRESLGGYALEPQGPGGVGDNGFAVGLMQVDKRWHADFVEQKDAEGSPLWKDAAANIEFGARLLAIYGKEFQHEGEAVEACAAAAYNAGPSHARNAIADLTRPAALDAYVDRLDQITTGQNYCSDVLARKERFLMPDHKGSPPPPKPEGVP